MTGGNVSTPRVITDGVRKDYIIQTTSVSDFYHHYKEDIQTIRRNGLLNALEHLLLGQESSH